VAIAKFCKRLNATLFAPKRRSEIFSDHKYIELNIKHYRSLLRRETDAAKRQTIENLLAEEEAKLAKMTKRGKEKK
jgi:hypothetical protein